MFGAGGRLTKRGRREQMLGRAQFRTPPDMLYILLEYAYRKILYYPTTIPSGMLSDRVSSLLREVSGIGLGARRGRSHELHSHTRGCHN